MSDHTVFYLHRLRLDLKINRNLAMLGRQHMKGVCVYVCVCVCRGCKCGMWGICILVLDGRHRFMRPLASRRNCGPIVSMVCWEGLRVTLERAA